jgi:hypothetical protein
MFADILRLIAELRARACRKRWRWSQSALEPTDFQALLTI